MDDSIASDIVERPSERPSEWTYVRSEQHPPVNVYTNTKWDSPWFGDVLYQYVIQDRVAFYDQYSGHALRRSFLPA